MKKDEIFFGEKGVTSTHAAYLSNVAKELYTVIEKQLNNFQFYTVNVGLIGTKDKSRLETGVTPDFLDGIDGKLMDVAKLKSLIAWLREALKAKDRLVSEAKNMSDNEIASILEIDVPVKPLRKARKTADDVVSEWNIKQRNRYYYLETLCSVYGSYVHPDGRLNQERDRLYEVTASPNKCTGSGRDTIIYSMEPTCAPALVDETFFKLQNTYREYQAELNSMKHEIELALQENDRELGKIEKNESDEYMVKMHEFSVLVNNYRSEAVSKAQALKIVIPDSLKSICDEVSKSGKKNK